MNKLQKIWAILRDQKLPVRKTYQFTSQVKIEDIPKNEIVVVSTMIHIDEVNNTWLERTYIMSLERNTLEEKYFTGNLEDIKVNQSSAEALERGNKMKTTQAELREQIEEMAMRYNIPLADLESLADKLLAQEIQRAVEVEKEKHRLKKCAFCKRKYRTDRGLQEHQSKCFKNPNRVCTMCDGDGLVDEVMNNGYMGHKNHPCYDCETAKRALTKTETREKL